MNRLTAACAVALSACVMLTACVTTAPLVNPREQTVSFQTTQDKMRSAILDAAKTRKWRVVHDEPGAMTLAYPGTAKAVHFEAIVKVDYDADSYQVSYVSSRGLDERQGCVNPKLSGKNKFDENIICVHRNVNRWMNNLSADIMNGLYR